jgi:hypothetical protein
MKKAEYIVCVWTKEYGWCLECLCGYDIAHAIKVMREKERKHPDKMFKVKATNPAENWWNVYGTN